jgi:hypothetical protein
MGPGGSAGAAAPSGPGQGCHWSAAVSQVPSGWDRAMRAVGPVRATAAPSRPVPVSVRSPVISASDPARSTRTERARSGSRMSITPARTRRIAACPAAVWSSPQDRAASGSYSATAASRSPSVRAAQASTSTSAGSRAAGGPIRSGASVNRHSHHIGRPWNRCGAPVAGPGHRSGLLFRHGHADGWQWHVLSWRPAGHPGRYARVGGESRGVLWEMRGVSGLTARPGQRCRAARVSGRRRAGARRERWSAPPARHRPGRAAVR